MNKLLSILEISKEVGLEDVLVSRPKAREMFDIAIDQMKNILCDDVVVCDFTGITACSSSFADEFVLNIQKQILRVENSIMILKNVEEDVSYDINAALRLRNEKDSLKLLLVSFNNGYEVEGDKLERNLREVFEIIKQKDFITSRDVSEYFHIEANSASNRLKKLHKLHLVLKQEVRTENGIRHAYLLPTI